MPSAGSGVERDDPQVDVDRGRGAGLADGKLTALDIATGDVVWEHELGPVFAGPSLSRGRVYVGGGNTLFAPRGRGESPGHSQSGKVTA